MIYIYLVVEDELSEAIGKKIIFEFIGFGTQIQVVRRNGSGYLKSRIEKFSELSRNYAVLMITDLDAVSCAPELKSVWLRNIDQPENFIFRVAVREVEAWLLADPVQLAHLFGVSRTRIPPNPENIEDPKRTLLEIARKAKREISRDIVQVVDSRSKQGLGYNRVLCPFVENSWDLRSASQNSDSLMRACNRVAELAERIEQEHHHA